MYATTRRPGAAAFQARAAPNSRSSKSAWQRATIAAVDSPEAVMSAPFPARRPLLDERRQPFDGVAGRHEVVEIEVLQRGELLPDALDEVEPGGGDGVPQRRRRPDREVRVEVRERRHLGVVGDRGDEPDAQRLVSVDGAAGEEEVLGRGAPDALREEAGGGRREDAE